MTIAELLVVLACVIVLAVVVLVLKPPNKSPSRRSQCASNLSQIGKACSMYADAATNNGRFPDDGVSALQSMNLLYRGYIRDARVFQCPQNPKDPLALNDIAKDLPNMTNAMTAYGYDRGHMQSDGMAGIASDYGARDEKVGNSTNHGADHGVGAGQQFLQGDGHVEWLKSPGRDTDQDGVDDDFIFDDDREAAGVENDSWIRDD